MKAGLIDWATAIGLTCMSASAALAQDEFSSRYTAAGLTSQNCKMAQGGAEGMSCMGPAGWVLNVGYPAFGVTINFTHEKTRRQAINPTKGRQVSIHDLAGNEIRIEWRGTMRHGAFEPHAAIVRVLVVDAAQRRAMIETGLSSPKAQPTQVLTVTRLGRDGSCLIAYVDAQANPKANELARAVADEIGPTNECPIERVEIRGIRTPVLNSYLD